MILSFDTSGPWVDLTLSAHGALIHHSHEAMTKGQAERLMPMIEAALRSAHVGPHDVEAIGVGIGPGNFTGIRIAVACARGLALSLGIPAIGVSSFEALLGEASEDARNEETLVVLPGPRGSLYAQLFGPQGASTPRHLDAAQPLPGGSDGNMPQVIAPENLDLSHLRIAARLPSNNSISQQISQIVSRRTLQGRPQGAPRPAPLYVKPADAAPSGVQPPVIL